MIYKNPYLMGSVAAVAVFGLTIVLLSSPATAGTAVTTMPSDVKNSWLTFTGVSSGSDHFGSLTIPQAIQKMDNDAAHASYAQTITANPYMSSAVPIKVGTFTIAQAIQQIDNYRPNTGDGILNLVGGEFLDPLGGLHNVSENTIHYDIPANSWLNFN